MQHRTGLPQIIILLFLANIALNTKGSEISMSVTTSNARVVLGQPIFASLTIKNESPQPLIVYPDDPDFLLVTIRNSSGEEVRTTRPYRSDLGGYSGYDVQPGEERTEQIALTQIARVPVAGVYTIVVNIPKFQITAPNFDAVVEPYNHRALDDWAADITRKIMANGPEAFLFAKALASIPSEISEPYACRLLTEKVWGIAIPNAVDMLRQAGSMAAARCLIQALPQHKDVERAYIESALNGIKKKPSLSPEERSEIDAAMSQK